MPPSNLHYFPLATPILLALFLLIALVIGLVEVGVLEYAYEKIGISRRRVFTLLILSLLGSYVNIPIAELPATHVWSNREITFFGMRYVIPVARQAPATVIAVNVGGAVIPVVLSLYLLARNRIWIESIVGIAIVAALVHRLAQPIAGVGIAVPTFVPPLIAAGAGLILSRRCAPCVAYVSGSLGTLIGADLMNLGNLQGLGAPIASIGGAGTFDGIFLTGILAVLLA